MENTIVHFVRLIPVASILLLFIVINVSDPTKSVASILLVFLLLYVFFVSVFFIVLHELLHKLPTRKGAARPTAMSHRRAYYIATALAFTPVILLAMQSLQQVKAFDLFLVFVLNALVIFYIVKRT